MDRSGNWSAKSLLFLVSRPEVAMTILRPDALREVEHFIRINQPSTGCRPAPIDRESDFTSPNPYGLIHA
jgi:hypothetical protein